MPIRFRCRYCNQLMGISRRKAGTTVTCPTCHAQVVVPHQQPELQAELPAAPAPLFERSDFEAFLQSPVAGKPSAPVPPPQPLAFATEKQASPSISTPSIPRLQAPGLVLSPTQATWLTVLVIVLVALAFGAGLLVGHWLGG